MSSAYVSEKIRNLFTLKEARRWRKSGFISPESLAVIQQQYTVILYHPNIMIRVLLFLATLLALLGVTGILGIFLSSWGEEFLSYGSILYGIFSLIILERGFIKKNNHYKSGVTEAIIYHACGFTIVGVAGIADFDSIPIITWTCFVVFTFTSIRYLDLVTTTCAILSFAYGVFYHLYEIGGIIQQLIPFAFIILFGSLFFVFRRWRNQPEKWLWTNVLILAESLCLLLAYAGGNYLVVRELSVTLMNLQLQPQGDIPFAFVFYFLTIILPILYLYFGIARKDVVLIRVSLFMVAFSVFTFKYYYSFGHPEITITVSGALLILVTLTLLNYLKTIRNGYSRENLLSEKWASSNVQAFVISQTMGGNTNSNQGPGGGASGGGGSTDQF